MKSSLIAVSTTRLWLESLVSEDKDKGEDEEGPEDCGLVVEATCGRITPAGDPSSDTGGRSSHCGFPGDYTSS
jgi:hypothetical protein